ncbi:MAG: hypothetical protein NTW48_04460 [Chloroflexi bacterium]|nr:hypothetical protein [Chloroflexota bacterium]
MELLVWASFSGVACAAAGGFLLGGLVYKDFKERGQLRRACGAIWGISLLFLGLLLAAGSYGWQIGGRIGVLVLVPCAILWGVAAWAGIALFGGSKRS